jgi:hypothetical protein
MQSYLEETRKRLREYARRLVNGQIEAEETWEGMSVNLPEKIGYKRIKKRFRQYGAQYYRFVPSPVFDNSRVGIRLMTNGSSIEFQEPRETLMRLQYSRILKPRFGFLRVIPRNGFEIFGTIVIIGTTEQH